MYLGWIYLECAWAGFTWNVSGLDLPGMYLDQNNLESKWARFTWKVSGLDLPGRMML